MKKLFLVAAAIAAMISVSCVADQSTPVDNGEKVGITVKLAAPGSSSTRLAEATGTSGNITITGGYIYVLDGGVVLHREALPADPKTAFNLKNGEKGFPTSSEVYVLANVPSGLTVPAVGDNMTAFANTTSEIINAANGANSNYKEPAMANTSGTSEPIGTADTNDVASITVDIQPLYARIEIAGIQGGGWISAFTLTNVYIDNYFSKFSLTGVGSVLNKADKDAEVLASQFGDPVSSGTWTTGNNPISAGTDEVWAYHVAAGPLAKVVFKLSSYTPFTANNADSQNPVPTATPDTPKNDVPTYITVDGNNNSVTSFVRGKIYKFKAISFNKKGQAAEEPSSTDVAISATITVTDWTTQDLDGVVIDTEE